jgi:hypothetical protein
MSEKIEMISIFHKQRMAHRRRTRSAIRFSKQQLRQRDIHRDPSRLILAEQLRGRSPARLILEIDIGELLCGRARQSRRLVPRLTRAAESGEEFPLPQLVAIDDGARNARHIVEDAALDKRVCARVAEQDQRRTIIITARIARDLPSLREQLVDR